MNIKELAEIAEVSVATVSKVLNNKDSSISAETRQKVLQLAKKYRYVPYANYKNNSSTNSYTVAFLADFKDPACGLVTQGLEDGLGANGYNLLVYNTNSSEKKSIQALHMIESANVNALVVLPFQNITDTFVEMVKKLAVPVLFLNYREDMHPFHHMDLDIQSAVNAALKRILLYDHKKIGCILDSASVHSSEILESYTHFCYENNIKFDSKYVCDSCGNIDGGQEGFKQLVHHGVTAILCQDELIAKGVYIMAEAFGLSIPEELSVISLSYGDSLGAMFPALCTVAMSAKNLGENAAAALIDHMERNTPLPEGQKNRELIFVEGKSLANPKEEGSANTRSCVVVVGSLNADFIIHVSSFPRPGETVLSPEIAKLPGGKGANQAVGVGKLGGNVYMIGRIGNDPEGKMLYQSLYENNVNLDGVTIEDNCSTGKAYIHVANSGESTIVVYPGANNMLMPSHIWERDALFEQAQYCLISTETRTETVKAVSEIAGRHSVKVVLKPSAVSQIADCVLRGLYILIPNEKEINCLLPDPNMSLEEKADHFLACGVENVIVTLGEKGCFLCNRTERTYFPAANFQAVDTTGAADSFISALVVALSKKFDLHYAIRFATYAAGITISREGVQPALPDSMMMRLYADKIKDSAEPN